MQFFRQFNDRKIIRLKKVASTNAQMKAWQKDESVPEGSVLSAIEQTEGKGQTGNVWQSEAGKNLTFSILYKPLFLKGNQAFYLSKLACLAVYRLAKRLLPENNIAIKWPNDLLIEEKKVAGILIENLFLGNQIQSSIIGIGLNVNQQIFADDIKERAASFIHFSKKEFDLEDLLSQLLTELDAAYLSLEAGHTAAIDRAYLQALYKYQEFTDMKIGNKKERVLIQGVQQSGKIAVLIENKMRYLDIKEGTFIF